MRLTVHLKLLFVVGVVGIQVWPCQAQFAQDGGGGFGPMRPRKEDDAVLLLEPVPVPDAVQLKKPLEALFRDAVEISDSTYGRSDYAAYEQVRQALIARSKESVPFLAQKLATSTDWREKLEASAVLGWISHFDLYRSLVSWHPPGRLAAMENPFPAQAGATFQKFSAASDAAVPLMLELVWKDGGLGYGDGLASVLVQRHVEAVLPLLVRRPAAVDRFAAKQIATFGSKATPFIVESFGYDSALDDKRARIAALGLIGDKPAVEALHEIFRACRSFGYAKETATALIKAKDEAWLRTQYGYDTGIHLPIIQAFGEADKSPATRAFLLGIASSPPTVATQDNQFWQKERTEAVSALLMPAYREIEDFGTMPPPAPTPPEDIAALCDIVLHEPDNSVRIEMLITLGRIQSPVVRATALKLLDERKILQWAIDCLKGYHDPEVTKRLLAFTKDADPTIRQVAAQALLHSTDPAVSHAANGLLQDPSEDVVSNALDILVRHPRPDALQQLTVLLAHPNRNLRWTATHAVRAIGSDAARAALEKALEGEKDGSLRNYIKDMLDDMKAHPGPTEDVDNEKPNDPNTDGGFGGVAGGINF